MKSHRVQWGWSEKASHVAVVRPFCNCMAKPGGEMPPSERAIGGDGISRRLCSVCGGVRIKDE